MIQAISIIALIFALVRLTIALSNYIFFLSLKRKDLAYEPMLSILIPARNEEKNIANILDDLHKQEYKNAEIIVLDDNSSDNTAGVVKEKMKKDKRVSLIFNDHVPAGWSGKNYACHLLSGNAGGRYLLFIDADIGIGCNIISEMTRYMTQERLVLVSIFPKQLMHSFGERITVPIMNLILLSLLPLKLVRSCREPSLAAANGQFMLFDAEFYRRYKPHEMLRSSLVEDIEIMRWIKKLKPGNEADKRSESRYRTAVLTGDRRISCRMYEDFNEAVHGFSKNILHFFGNSLVWTSVFLFLTGPVIIFLILHSLTVTFTFLLLNVITRTLVSLNSKQNIIFNILLAPLQQLSFYFIVYKAVRIKLTGKYTWKGRRIEI